jgi:hypothetical protein
MCQQFWDTHFPGGPMDLAMYCVDAVLVEGRSVRAVAAATGRFKSFVQRHVTLYRAGGVEALVPLSWSFGPGSSAPSTQ